MAGTHTNQNGVFSIHKINGDNKFIAFNENKLIKIIIKPEHFSDIKEDLNTLGINNSMIFPDIDGLCKHLEYRFTHEKTQRHNKKACKTKRSFYFKQHIEK